MCSVRSLILVSCFSYNVGILDSRCLEGLKYFRVFPLVDIDTSTKEFCCMFQSFWLFSCRTFSKGNPHELQALKLTLLSMASQRGKKSKRENTRSLYVWPLKKIFGHP